MEYKSETKQDGSDKRHISHTFISQNVRGFALKDVISWMSVWRRGYPDHSAQFIMLQETHVATADEWKQLARHWALLWGEGDRYKTLSYRSIFPKKRGGVAILLVPSIACNVMAWKKEHWSNRLMILKWNETIILNIYGPSSDAKKRDRFYNGVRQVFIKKPRPCIMGGDFNCVDNPVLDRLGGVRATWTECEALRRLLHDWELWDARTLMVSPFEDLHIDPHEHFTYWRGNQASRIDRFYVSGIWKKWVNWVAVVPPPIQSDHNQVSLYLKNPEQPRDHNGTRRSYYPFPGSQKDVIREKIENELATQQTCQYAQLQWDNWLDSCKTALYKVRRSLARRRKKRVHQLRRSVSECASSRKNLIHAIEETLHTERLTRRGYRLHRSAADIRWLFKRASVWEKDQTVTNIEALPGQVFAEDLSIPNKFAETWKPILSHSHRTVSSHHMNGYLTEFMTIPTGNKVSDKQNMELMAAIDVTDVEWAIKHIERRKAAGQDGIGNDFYKDFSPILLEPLTAVFNSILKGADPPKSFLKAIVIPLRKKGDSSNALDYRPISLLTTSYKLFAKILARRLQKFLGHLIGDTQQGFVSGRRMDKAVLLMKAVFKKYRKVHNVSAAESAGVLFLDFSKAYDTVDRKYLFAVLRLFGFSPGFVALMDRLHSGTSAEFLVNNQLSHAIHVKSGIRQGCPLAPLLFILAVEPLALALKKETGFQGIQPLQGVTSFQHKFSAFVDDSTVFIQHAEQTPAVLAVVKRFGDLSGLKIQPDKSKFVFLHSNYVPQKWYGVPVLPEGETVRYLGYQFGWTDLRSVNWAIRLKCVQRRLVIATTCGTSVVERVQLFNVIAIPSILFTARMFEIPTSVLQELVNLQKAFIWSKSTRTERGRHKISPTLLFTPHAVGGVGLISIPVALKVQRLKLACQWLLASPDYYQQTWLNLVGIIPDRGIEYTLTPVKGYTVCQAGRSVEPRGVRSLKRDIMEWLGPRRRECMRLEDYATSTLPKAVTEMESRIGSKGGQLTPGEKFVISLDIDRYAWHEILPSHMKPFWGTYCWALNPWIREERARELGARKYDRIPLVSIKSLRILRLTHDSYMWQVQGVDGKAHTRAKTGRWLCALILASPRVHIGHYIGEEPQINMTIGPPILEKFTWKRVAPGRLLGVGSNNVEQVVATQQADGLRWKVTRCDMEEKAHEQELNELAIVFQPHPATHLMGWKIDDTAQTWKVWPKLRRSFRRMYQYGVASQLSTIVEKWKRKCAESEWWAKIQDAEPAHLWKHDNMLTNYQVWVQFRMATMQLNTFHTRNQGARKCLLDDRCSSGHGGVEHIFWECARAKDFWRRLVQHWEGVAISDARLQSFQEAIVTRQAPPVGDSLKRAMLDKYGWFNDTYHAVFERIWNGICGIATSWMWHLRNQVVFQGQIKSAFDHQEFLWHQCRTQVEAVAECESRLVDTREAGIRLKISVKCFFDITPAPDQNSHSIQQERIAAISTDKSTMESEPRLHTRFYKFIVANS